MTSYLTVLLPVLLNLAGSGQAAPKVLPLRMRSTKKHLSRSAASSNGSQSAGSNRYNPVILGSDGGPGVSNAPFAPAFIAWEKDFTLVEWDQRVLVECLVAMVCKGPDCSRAPTQDAIELTQHLRSRLQKDKVILFALSFGSVIGLKTVQARPELFAAYVGSGQFINAADGHALGYQLTLAQARAIGNGEAISALETMGPPPWPDVKTRSAAKGWATRMTKADDPASKMNVPAMFEGIAP